MKKNNFKIPKVPLEIWKPLYQEAIEFSKKSPWNDFKDNYLFAVQNPFTREIGYCCIMGSLGEYHALGIYRGDEGLFCYQRIQSGEFDDNEWETLLYNNSLMVEFCNLFEELEKEDLKIIKQLKIKRSGFNSIPCFRSSIPCCFPWFITEEEARYLTIALKCSNDLVNQFRKDPSKVLPKKPNSCLLYIPSTSEEAITLCELEIETSPSISKKPAPEYCFDKKSIATIKNKKLKRSGIWEAGVTIAPGEVFDRERPYLPRVLLLVDRKSFFVLSMNAISLEKDQNLEFCRLLLESIEKHQILPEKIVFSDQILAETVQPLTKHFQIEIEVGSPTPALNDFKKELIMEFSKK